MSKNLVIVESPAKAKTIEKYLGADYKVTSCYGHIRDLAKDDISIEISNGFQPVYQVPDDKKKIVADLKKMAKKAEMVWLASDEDREGEAISWHLAEVLDLKAEKTKRIVFNEITKTAIQKAIQNPRDIDQHLVDAQQARRILDRIVGYELSPVLWKKVKPSLSAGRVQSVAVRLIVEREREILNFTASSSFRVTAICEVNGKQFKASLPKRFPTQEEAQAYLDSCKNAEFNIAKKEVKPAKKMPAPPFTTSTLQQEASRKLGYSVSRTMTLAQRLYESGLITYMRTDSVNLSEFARASAKAEIESSYGKNYSKTRNYSNKAAGAQEAHEAIRPTEFATHTAGADDGQTRLYELIWKRAIASQMSEAQLEKTNIKIACSNNDELLEAKGEIIKFDGFLKVYLESVDDDDEKEEEGLLPDMNEGDTVSVESIAATQRYTRPPARYTEASLVKKLEELGIGRPSTYAPTISTVQKRGYVNKESLEGTQRKYTILHLKNNSISEKIEMEITGADKNKLIPTDIGKVVTDFLVEHFGGIMDYHFTANVEKEFDNIADGAKQWSAMIDSFYHPFHKEIDTTLEEAKKATGERILGTDPKTGKDVLVRIGRFGPMAQIGSVDDEEKPRFASLQHGQTIDTITLEEALNLFNLPREVGEFEGSVMKVAIGRFGPYVQHSGKFVSLDKEDDPYSIGADRAIELIEAKRKADKEKMIKTFTEDDNMQILKGRWGPYLKQGKKNYRIPKGTEAADLSYQDCLKMIEEQDKNPKKGRSKAKAKK